MRSGSPAQDDGGWPSAQSPRSDGATGNQGRYGSGPRSQASEGQGGRRDVPFGPEISWPYGFRQLDPESREVLESAYGTGPAYQQPAMDDYGYGDPGYSDPSYEGPKIPYGSPAFPGGPGNAAAPRPSGRSRLPAARRRGARVPRAGGPRLLPARLPGSRLPAAGVRATARRPGDLAGDRRPGGPSRHRAAARRGCPGRPSRGRAAPRTRISGTTIRAWATGTPATCVPPGRLIRGSRA